MRCQPGHRSHLRLGQRRQRVSQFRSPCAEISRRRQLPGAACGVLACWPVTYGRRVAMDRAGATTRFLPHPRPSRCTTRASTGTTSPRCRRSAWRPRRRRPPPQPGGEPARVPRRSRIRRSRCLRQGSSSAASRAASCTCPLTLPSGSQTGPAGLVTRGSIAVVAIRRPAASRVAASARRAACSRSGSRSRTAGPGRPARARLAPRPPPGSPPACRPAPAGAWCACRIPAGTRLSGRSRPRCRPRPGAAAAPGRPAGSPRARSGRRCRPR